MLGDASDVVSLSFACYTDRTGREHTITARISRQPRIQNAAGNSLECLSRAGVFDQLLSQAPGLWRLPLGPSGRTGSTRGSEAGVV